MWPFPRANTDPTCEVLRRLCPLHPKRPLQVIWYGASYHRAGKVSELAEERAITLLPLPGYSPDFMPIEPLYARRSPTITATPATRN